MGSDEYNMGLSRLRAESVKNYLESAGLEVGAIRTEGRSETNPRLPNTSEANRSLNRRIEITFVTNEGEVLEPVVVDAGTENAPKRVEYTFMVPATGTVVSNVESQPVKSAMIDGECYQGDTNPRQVIGLNGALEPGETFVVTYSESDEALREVSNEVTAQLDFKPNETLVLRRLGGEMAMNCRANGYSYTTNYPPLPLIKLGDEDPVPPPRYNDVASPN